MPFLAGARSWSGAGTLITLQITDGQVDAVRTTPMHNLIMDEQAYLQSSTDLELHAFELRGPCQQEGRQHICEELPHARALCQVRVPEPDRQLEGDLSDEQAIHPSARRHKTVKSHCAAFESKAIE